MNIDFIRDIFAKNPAYNESPIVEPRTRVSSGSFRNITRVSAPFIDTRAISQTRFRYLRETEKERRRERTSERDAEEKIGRPRARCISLGALIYKSDRDRGDSRGLVGDII